MAATTYRKIAELASDFYYKGKASDDANYDLRFFAELAAIYVAEAATFDAFTNSNQGESTYSNDQFISTYKNQPIQAIDGDKVIKIPATPSALPNGQEIVSVFLNNNKKCPCIPMKANSEFAQNILGIPCGMVLYKVSGGNIILVSDNNMLEGTVTITMVGAVSGSDLLTSDLNVPKNYEAYVLDKIMSKLLPLKQIPQDNLNNAVSNPA